MISSEESIVYSQAIHYANRMVYMKIPLNVSEMMPRAKPSQNLTAMSSCKFLLFSFLRFCLKFALIRRLLSRSLFLFLFINGGMIGIAGEVSAFQPQDPGF